MDNRNKYSVWDSYQSGQDNEIQNQLRQAQANQLVQEALRSQQMLPYDQMRAQAYADQVRQAGMPKPARAVDLLKERQDSMLNSRASISALHENNQAEEALALIEKIDPELAAALRKSPDPAKGINAWLRATGEQNKNVSGLMGRQVAADASKNVAEIGYHKTIGAAKIAADAKIQAQQMATEATKSGQQVDPKKIFGKIIMDKVASGEYNADDAAEAMLSWQTANKQIDPVKPGVAIQVQPQGGAKLVNTPTEKTTPRLPPNRTDKFNEQLSGGNRANKLNASTQLSPQDWDKAWAALPKGGSMVGLDGKTYTK